MMDTAMRWIAGLWIVMLAAPAAMPQVARSSRLQGNVVLNTDPDSGLWLGAPAVMATHSAKGEETPRHRTEIRSRWTDTHLYFLFICHYEELYVNPNPVTDRETNRLWERDVAEIFIGADFERIWQYREFQVSPQGEWVDLDIDLKEPKPEGGWRWNSGFETAARIDAARKVWYGAFQIPVRSITDKRVGPGFEFRVNFYRLQGPPPRKSIAWRATGPTGNHHIPEAFGILRLEE
jgi:hypothetical protein